MKRLIAILVTLFCCWTFSFSAALADDNLTITKEQIQWGEETAQKALEATHNGDLAQAETYWSQLVDTFPTNPAVWSNRGNARVGQNKLELAISDFEHAISLAPNAPDPYLNRGTALEAMGEYQKAIADYNKVLELDPEDAFAYNNRGNAAAGLGKWQNAIEDYQKAAEIAPNFAFAQANLALALYETGKQSAAITKLKNIARKYPMFPDVRAALTAALWEKGQQGEAESNWVAAVGMDTRYQDLDWVTTIRRWPPSMIGALDNFLNLK
ncbi:MAG: tetratricopeptide repeat protein [Microcystaceae cyanobacterium]